MSSSAATAADLSLLALVEKLRALAGEKGVSTAQLAIAWVMAQGPDIVPLIGARTRQRLTESLGAAEISLSADELAGIARAIPADAASGERYPAALLAHLDSEK